jgi:hypothetical protein
MMLENEATETICPNRISSVLGEFIAQRKLHAERCCAVLSVNTQARRLGSLLYLLGKIKAGVRLVAQLERPPATEIDQLRSNLRLHQLTSGEISTARSSVDHYLTLAQDLHLVVRQGSLHTLTAHGQLLMALVRPPCAEPYPLSQNTKLCILAILLRHDFIGLKSLIRLMLTGVLSVDGLCNEYQESLLASLEEALECQTEQHTKRLFFDRRSQIQKWNNPAKYSDHLVPARLHWLKDLAVIHGSVGANGEHNIAVEYLPWMMAVCSIKWPNERDVYDLVESYCSATYDDAITLNAAGDSTLVCSALDQVFIQNSGLGPIEKVRADIAALHLTSTQMPLLRNMARNRQSFWGNSRERLCGKTTYGLHPAARSTQAYVLRHTPVEGSRE